MVPHTSGAMVEVALIMVENAVATRKHQDTADNGEGLKRWTVSDWSLLRRQGPGCITVRAWGEESSVKR